MKKLSARKITFLICAAADEKLSALLDERGNDPDLHCSPRPHRILTVL